MGLGPSRTGLSRKKDWPKWDLDSLFLCLVDFWWCLKRRNPEMCTFGVLWLWCEAPEEGRTGRGDGKSGPHHTHTTHTHTHTTHTTQTFPLNRCRVVAFLCERNSSGRSWKSNAKWPAALPVPACGGSDASVRCFGTNGWQSLWLWQRPSITRPA